MLFVDFGVGPVRRCDGGHGIRFWLTLKGTHLLTEDSDELAAASRRCILPQRSDLVDLRTLGRLSDLLLFLRYVNRLICSVLLSLERSLLAAGDLAVGFGPLLETITGLRDSLGRFITAFPR